MDSHREYTIRNRSRSIKASQDTLQTGRAGLVIRKGFVLGYWLRWHAVVAWITVLTCIVVVAVVARSSAADTSYG